MGHSFAHLKPTIDPVSLDLIPPCNFDMETT